MEYNQIVQTIGQYERSDAHGGQGIPVGGAAVEGAGGALMERRRWYGQAGQLHSGGETEAIVQLQQELDRRIDAAAKYELESMRLIDALEDMGQRDVLRYRYLNGLGWKEIAVRMKYSQDWVKHVHGKALKALREREVKI